MMGTQTTSALAYDIYKENGKKERDHEIILWVLKTYGELTAFGIAKKAFYRQKDNFDVERTYKLNYVAVSRRMSELCRANLVEQTDKIKDADNSIRMGYVAL